MMMMMIDVDDDDDDDDDDSFISSYMLLHTYLYIPPRYNLCVLEVETRWECLVEASF